jgi:PST family polysaccharide transporter
METLMGLLVSIPVYYYYRIDAIIPTMIIISLSSFFVCILFFKKNRNSKIISQSKSYCLKEKASSSWLFTNNKRIIDFSLFNSNYVGKIGGLEEVGFILQVLHC